MVTYNCHGHRTFHTDVRGLFFAVEASAVQDGGRMYRPGIHDRYLGITSR